jgi:N-acetylglucosaminyldiphosphoundecaprenol N-acetyl-beta-D-mannosaminyltransferase
MQKPGDDFDRDVWCILGLPFDAVDMSGAVQRVRDAVRVRARCFMSTPNLNFLIASQDDAGFRQSVLDSDLSLADGMPILWLARLTGVPLPERVAGSDVFAVLREGEADRGREAAPTRTDGDPLRVFFFGGQEGIAERACERLNAEGGGLRCVGAYGPGFGSLDEMSAPAVIAQVNASEADLLVVALGARKGQAWIVRNLAGLTIPVVSHLGAVINFVAGNVRRAPAWMRRAGLEWAWRIREEPALWRRYAGDGLELLWLMVTRVMPFLVWRLVNRGGGAAPAEVAHGRKANSTGRIALRGGLVASALAPVRQAFREAAAAGGDLVVDLGGVTRVDGAFLGLLLVLEKHVRRAGGRLVVENTPSTVRRIFRWNGVGYLVE